jgi:hypothetical protein
MERLSGGVSNRGPLRAIFLRDPVVPFDGVLHTLSKVLAVTVFLANLRRPLVRLGDRKHSNCVVIDFDDDQKQNYP